MNNNSELVFISYSHKDRPWKDRLMVHLEGLTWSWPTLNPFVDSNMHAGAKWEEEISAALDNTAVAVLLISSSFLNSSFIRKKELPVLLKRHQTNNIPIVPVIIEPCLWEESEISQFLASPEDGKPLTQLSKKEADAVIVSIAREINRLYFKQAATAKKIQVLIADDHAYAVKGIKELIADTNDMITVAGCTSPSEVENQAQSLQPDIALLDMAWFRNGEIGLDLIPTLQRLAPEMKIIAISNYPELLMKARKLGVYTLEKSFTINQLYTYIRDVHHEKLKEVDSVYFDLTEREKEVLKEVATGYGDKDIAKRLDISPNTAKKHVANIIAKLKARSRTDAAVKAVEYKLLE